MSVESDPQQPDKLEHPKSNFGLVDKLKAMLHSGPEPTAADLARKREENSAQQSAAAEARLAGLNQRADSGEMPIVRSGERNAVNSGEVPVVEPTPDTPDAPSN